VNAPVLFRTEGGFSSKTIKRRHGKRLREKSMGQEHPQKQAKMGRAGYKHTFFCQRCPKKVDGPEGESTWGGEDKRGWPYAAGSGRLRRESKNVIRA